MYKCVVSTMVFVLAWAAPALGGQGFLTIKDGRFVDAAGRQVILHGINVGEKHKRNNYASWHSAGDFARMRQWGFNCVRLLLIWAAIEPEPGRYDEAYLRRIDQRIAWAKANGLVVLLDMHQDLWGENVPGGDGAPGWATLDDGQPHLRAGQVWSDAYFSSRMIQTAFDNFWANRPGPDQVGIQDRFARMWQHVARRYADEPAVVGYDLFNEPFPGSPILLAQMLMGRHVVGLLRSDGSAANLPKLTDMLADPEVYRQIHEKFDDVGVYRSFLASAERVFKMFERNRLAPMYNRVARAIRQVDTRHILFLEPCMYATGGFASDLQPVVDADGKRDPLQGLAPHAYDIGTEKPGIGSVNRPRMELIFGRLTDLGRRLGMPILVGEWGAFRGEPYARDLARLTVSLFEQAFAGDTYWFFHKGIEKTPQFEMLQRPFPSAVAGTLTHYRLDSATGRFECVWTEDPTITEPSRVYLPANWYPRGYGVTLEPAGTRYRADRIRSDRPDEYLIIPPTGHTAKRCLTVHPNP